MVKVCRETETRDALHGSGTLSENGIIPPAKEVHRLVSMVAILIFVRRFTRESPSRKQRNSVNHQLFSTRQSRWSVENGCVAEATFLLLVDRTRKITPSGTHRNGIINCQPYYSMFFRSLQLLREQVKTFYEDCGLFLPQSKQRRKQPIYT